MKLKTILVAACAIILVACGGGSDSPEAVTTAFVKAISSKDFEGAKKYCTKNSASIIDGLKSFAAMAPETKLSKEDCKCDVKDDKATCTFCCAEGKSEEKYTLVKEDGKWKVEYVKTGMDNAGETIGEGMNDLKDAVDTLSNAIDTLSGQ